MVAALSGTDLGFTYFRLPSVRSADSLATKEAPHQLEDGPPLIAFAAGNPEIRLNPQCLQQSDRW